MRSFHRLVCGTPRPRSTVQGRGDQSLVSRLLGSEANAGENAFSIPTEEKRIARSPGNESAVLSAQE